MKQFDLQEYLKNPNRKIITRDGREIMNKYYCLYCKHYKPTQCGSEGTEPEGICCNPHTAIDYVYGHEYCDQYDDRKEKQI